MNEMTIFSEEGLSGESERVALISQSIISIVWHPQLKQFEAYFVT
jgi:hypothetical protein